MTLHRRLASNTVINILALGLNALLQLLQVSLLTAVWSLEKYGIWLMLSTIPSYFALSDLGFSSAAQSDMSMSYAAGDECRTRCTYQSIWVFLLAVSSLVILLASPLLAAAQLPDRFTYFGAWRPYGQTVFLFAVYAATGLCSRVVLAGFRATGLYAIGSLLYESLVFLEGMAIVGIALRGGSFDACVTTGILSRVVCTLVTDWFLRRSRPFMGLGYSDSSFSEIRRLTRPAFAAMATPIALAINIQGVVLVVGYMLSPVAVATLTPVRTASRIVLQVVGAVNRGAMPEISRAASIGDGAALARLLRANTLALLYALLPGAVLFALFGTAFVVSWTNGRVHPEFEFTALMAAAMFTQGLWYFMSNFLLATNEHLLISKSVLASAIVTLMLAVPAAREAGLNGVAAANLCGELITLFNVYRNYRRSSFCR